MKKEREMRTVIALCSFAVLAGVFTSPASAATKTIVASKDNTLYEDPDGILSNGAGEHFFVGLSGPFVVTVRRGVLSFNIAGALPNGAIIESAELRLHLSASVSGDITHTLHRLTADWGEAGSDAPGAEGGGFSADPGDATWLHNFYDNSFWVNPGGDFNPTISASQVVSGTGFYTWSSAQLAADVQDMLVNPEANFGWLIMGGETSAQSAKRYDTRENDTAEFRPMLIISYKIPAPGALALLGLGALASRRRHR